MVWSLQKLSHQECGGHRARPRPPGAEDVGATVGSAGGGQGLGPGERPLEEGRGEPETLFPRQPAAGTEPARPAQFACHHFQAARQGFLPPPSSPALLPLREASPRPPSPPVSYCLGTSRCGSPHRGGPGSSLATGFGHCKVQSGVPQSEGLWFRGQWNRPGSRGRGDTFPAARDRPVCAPGPGVCWCWARHPPGPPRARRRLCRGWWPAGTGLSVKTGGRLSQMDSPRGPACTQSHRWSPGR